MVLNTDYWKLKNNQEIHNEEFKKFTLKNKNRKKTVYVASFFLLFTCKRYR